MPPAARSEWILPASGQGESDSLSEEHALEQVATAIWDDAVSRDFRGFDPYDGLRSRLLWPLVRESRPLRLALQQFVKRAPVNVRPLIGVRRGLNPKGLALFLSGVTDASFIQDARPACKKLQRMLLASASTPQGSPFFGSGSSRSDEREPTADEIRSLESGRIGWGYDFPWQGRAFFLPAHFPTAVCTCFVVEALRKSRHRMFEQIARSAGRFVSLDLHCSSCRDGVCYSYSPADDTCVYNASLFAAKLLALAWKSGGPKLWEQDVQDAARRVIAAQNEDGSWTYGEGESWQWVDGLHTGFILETLEDLSLLLATDDYIPAIRKGLAFYRARLFSDDGTALERLDRPYPLDPHTFAQGAITFSKLRRHDEDGIAFAHKITAKAIELLWDPASSTFRTRKSGTSIDRTRYMRWSQAWMFRAICAVLARERAL